jgi:hypothetical protein
VEHGEAKVPTTRKGSRERRPFPSSADKAAAASLSNLTDDVSE